MSWNSLNNSYDDEKLFKGGLAVLQLSHSSLSDYKIIEQGTVYTPIARLPDYYSCLFERDGESQAVETLQFEKKL